MKKTILNDNDILEIINLYNTTIKSIHKLAKHFKTSHKEISKILKSHNVILNKRGGQIKTGNSQIIEKSKTKKYSTNNSNKKLIAVCKKTHKVFYDVNNLSGVLTNHILKEYGDIKIPATNYLRKKYEILHGQKWFEEYFDIIEKNIEEKRKCKLCNWDTIDILNKTGCFEKHIRDTHQLNIEEYLDQFPDEIKYHPKLINQKKRNIEFKNDNNYVVCRLCNQKMKVITNTHLKNKHKITSSDYKLLYPNEKLSSESSIKIFKKNIIIQNQNMKPSWTSNGEKEIRNYIMNLGLNVEKSRNRNLLNGKEIDLVIPKLKIAIEYNGLYYHTEKMGKNSTYHLDKTISCNEIGYKLYQIYEDEWMLKKDMVKNKLKYIFKLSNDIKIGARKIQIRKITPKEKSEFLNDNHLQGNDKSLIFYGAFYNNMLVGVMTFNSIRNMTKSNKNEYELSRFAIKQGYCISGLASKMIKRFIYDYNPSNIISFADRRWTPDGNNNLYITIGFKLTKIIKPRYFYYNSKIDRYKRFHKFGFGKTSLKKKYPNLDFSKTEKQLTEELGFDKIWDCGLFKYELNLNDNL